MLVSSRVHQVFNRTSIESDFHRLFCRERSDHLRHFALRSIHFKMSLTLRVATESTASVAPPLR